MKKILPLTFAVLATVLPSNAADDVRGDHPEVAPHTPEEEQKLFHLPPGFEIQLVASEPDIQKPINLNFDAQGRLWVTGSAEYPWPASVDAVGTPIPNFEKAYQDIANAFAGGRQPPPISNVAKDTIRILSDFDARGHAEKIDVFADGLNIPSGLQPLPRKPGDKGDSVIAYSLPNIWRFSDTTGSGKADKREILYGPFAFLDTHGGCSSYIQWIDGWIYATLGFRNHSEVKDRTGKVTVFDSGSIVRFRPDGSRIEYFTHGQTNPFGLAFDPFGDLYSADSHSKPVYLLLQGGYYEGINKQHDGLGFAPHITEDDHGSSAIGGMMNYADDKWPEEFRGNTFNGNVVTNRINRDKLEWHGSTPAAIRQPDFLVCDDKWFRPVNFKLGPDGALWIADFYNAIIGHYEVPLTDPHRDHTHGRIWRVVYVGDKKGGQEAPLPPPPNISTHDVNALITDLSSPNLELRRLAANELTERVGESAVATLNNLVAQSGESGSASLARSNVQHPERLYALWILQRLGKLSDEAIVRILGSADLSTSQIYALRILAEHPELDAKAAAMLEAALNNRAPDVQRAAATAFSRLVGLSPELQKAGVPPSNVDAADSELSYALLMARRDWLVGDQFRTAIQRLEALAKPAPDEDSKKLLAEANANALAALGAPTAEAGGFLLSYLKFTKLGAPRTGDCLKHAALHIATDKFPALIALANEFPNAALEARLSLADGVFQAARVRGVKLEAATAKELEALTISALSTSDESILKHAIEAVRNEKDPDKLEPLVKIVSDQKRAPAIRTAALDALANVDAKGAAISAALADTSSITVRKRAADLLGQMNIAEARASLAGALPTASFELAMSIGGALAKSDAGAELLLSIIESGKAPPAILRHNAVAGPLGARPQSFKDRAAALTKDLPPEDARLDKVIAQRVDAFRAAKPNVEHGQQVFQQNCFICHRIKGNGGNIGPNLDGIASRGVHRLIEDILDPSRNVDPAFRQVILETSDGRTLAGVGLHENGQLLVMSDATGKEVSVPKDQVKTQTTSRISLMPPNFEQALPPADLNDLVAFLLGQSEVGK